MFRPIEVFEKLLSIHLLSSFEFQLRILSFQIVEWPPGIPYSAPQSLFKNHVVSIHEGRQVLPAIDTIISDQRLLPIELELFSVISSGVEIHEKIELLSQRGDHGSTLHVSRTAGDHVKSSRAFASSQRVGEPSLRRPDRVQMFCDEISGIIPRRRYAD